jgi:hypothetical protein
MFANKINLNLYVLTHISRQLIHVDYFGAFLDDGISLPPFTSARFTNLLIARFSAAE